LVSFFLSGSLNRRRYTFQRMTSDLDLVRQFAQENSQDAFGEIVRRHLDLVYSAALRQVRSPQLAEEVAQSVFADLARDAHKLKSDTILTAWLYAVARRAAIDTVRRESRRQLREQIAVEMNDMNATADDWAQIAPLLDDAMAALDEADRTAILLRYFENKSLREVGDSLNISDDAAQKRVSRAVESLREFFSKQRLAIGAGGLAVLISANSVQSAPVELAGIILRVTLATTPIIGMTIMHKILLGGMAAAAAAAGACAIHLQNQIGTLERQNASLNSQIAQLQQERDNAMNQLADLQQENKQSQADRMDLLRLRGEVTRLRNLQNMPQTASHVETNNAESTPIQIHTKAIFISIPAEDVQGVGIEWLPGAQTGGGKIGLLPEEQYRPILKALQEASDVEDLAEPEATAREGRQIQMRATSFMGAYGQKVEVGPILDSQCFFSTNSHLFTLKLAVTLIGMSGDASQPGFQMLEITNQMDITPAQTAVLETEIPPGIWLPDYTNAPDGSRSLLVFVTPDIIDRAGNRVDPYTGKVQ
jgi:RNA polymerase sigma factor (sigma-70 family)